MSIENLVSVQIQLPTTFGAWRCGGIWKTVSPLRKL